ncbi:MAG: dihydrodipicolinate synthase family protein [Bryobacteraceae bacterium]|nr:dihydrodipicolinate synthase family protein [Bryobacteraceae bacterium]
MLSKGVWVPLTTPFDFSGGIYRAKVAHNVSRLSLTKVTGFLIGSSTGEGTLLSPAELIDLFDLVQADRPKVAVVGLPAVKVAVELAVELVARGAQAIQTESPWPAGSEEDKLYRGCIADRVPVVAIDAPPLANALPYAYLTIFDAERTRELDAAADWRARLAPVEAAVAKYGIAGLKYAMELTGYYGGPPRLPRVPLRRPAQVEIEEALAGLRS